jgi:C-terminal processing protease CtpA/Prc
MPHRNAPALTVILALLLLANLRAQQPTSPEPRPGAISKTDRERALGILDAVSKGIQNLYYDPKMNGLDWSATLSNARDKIAASSSLNEALTQIAVAVDALHDSHTRFQPPARPYRLDFGFEYKMIWSLCFVTRVRPGSDAEAKGLKPGAQILTINGTVPTRQNLRNIEYLDYILNPRPEMRLEIQDPSLEKHRIEIEAKMTSSPDLAYQPGAVVLYDVMRSSENLRHRMRPQLAQFGEVGILKLPWFNYRASSFYNGPRVEDTFYDLPDKIHKDKALIVDLRGNHGGLVDSEEYFTGMFFDHDVKVFDKVQRKKTSPEVAKKGRYFPGKLIVLVDSESASAAEIFARVMQLEKRGLVMGDRTSGSVMEATSFYFASSGVDYGAEVTVANLIMADGKSLEHVGVSPDEVALPQPFDLETARDPVLARAAKEFGVTITPEAAGKLFPYEWPKD